jgi:hypothetical protein
MSGYNLIQVPAHICPSLSSAAAIGSSTLTTALTQYSLSVFGLKSARTKAFLSKE